MRLNRFLAVLFVVALSSPAQPQQPKNVPRIGFLIASTVSSQEPRLEAFRQGLRELGYIEGQNVVLHVRSGEGKLEQLPLAAAELIRLKVDVIVTGGPTSTSAAKKVTNSIPVVMTQDNDPVGDGSIASLARSCGNVTGLSTLGPELGGKRLEILKDVLPNVSRVAMFTTAGRHNAPEFKEIELTATTLGVSILIIELRAAEDIDPAFQSSIKARAGSVLAQSSNALLSQRVQVAKLAVKYRLPVIYAREEFVEVGGLMHYAPSTRDLSRRAATYVDKILKGAKPADLPVEQPTKFELVINLKTAKQIGLTIPASVLYRADRVIR